MYSIVCGQLKRWSPVSLSQETIFGADNSTYIEILANQHKINFELIYY